jgi:hypothetical protein
MKRLADAGITPKQVLTEAASLYLLARWSPRVLPDDERLTYQIGLRVLRLAHDEKRYSGIGEDGKARYHYRPPGKTLRREVGQRIRLNLAPLFVGISEEIDRQREREQAFRMSLSKPFPAAAPTEGDQKDGDHALPAVPTNADGE